MDWNLDSGIDVTSAFQGITTPPRELYDEIHRRGWDVSKVDIKDGQYVATVQNPFGEKIEKTGPDPATALGHALVGIMRQETMRSLARTSAWENTWEDQLGDIAKAYAKAPVYDPKAASAWKELADDSTRRAEAIANQVRVDFTPDPYPYEDVNEMQDDLRNKKRITVSEANLDHPVWSRDQALAYRLVHDVLGHAQVGGDWGWHGENGATAAHMPLVSPEAQKALFTEAIGQAAHNHFYRGIGPQKIVFLDDHLEDVQKEENSAGHAGVHPSQTIVPGGIPSIPTEAEELDGKTSSADSIEARVAEIVGGRWNGVSISWPNGQHVFLDAVDNGGTLDLMNIRAEPEGTGAGSEVLKALQQVCQEAGMPIRANEVLAPGFFQKHEFTNDEDYDPELYGHEEPDQWWYPRESSVLEKLDPNDGWESGVEPLPDNAYLWQKEESGLDPLDYQGGKDAAHKINTGWAQLEDHEGIPDRDSQRQAVVNAFRSVLLQPRKDPRWAATHYQHVQHIPATVSDPLRYTDALDAQREAHNQARGLPEGIHRQEWLAESEALRGWLKTLHPELDDTKVDDLARRELFHMIAEEEERVTGDDPASELMPMQINDLVNKAIKKRLAVATKSNIDQKFDFGRDRLYHKAFAPDPGIYGDFLHSHVRPIAGVGLHADKILRAAREDVANHGGKGHYFRGKVSDLVPGVGPNEISHAWMLLQPHTSQLGVISPSVAEALGHDRDEEVSPRDYYKLERQLAAGRDAAGYTHVPLGQFSWGLHDRMNYGHGVHRDLSPFAAANPTPYDQFDWNGYPNRPTQEWDDPYWWKSTEPVRDEVGKQWDQMVATQHPAHEIPYRYAAMTPSRDVEMTKYPNTPQWELPNTPLARGVLPIPVVTHPQSGEVIEGDPNKSLMQHAKDSLGMTTEEVWDADPEISRQQRT
jgi:hypothetical protein